MSTFSGPELFIQGKECTMLGDSQATFLGPENPSGDSLNQR